MRARIVAVSAILALVCVLPGAPALADGDPASDVLATESLFLPQDANIPTVQQTELYSLLRSAARSGYPLHVAIVASPTDLGSITPLWRQPQSYASFLGQELSLAYRGPLLVVMPNGFGVYGVAGAQAPSRAPLSAIASPGAAAGIGGVTLTAIERLASAAGHPLPPPAATVAQGPSAGHLITWIAFAIGALAVAGAWAASLRTRPLQLRGRAARSG